MRALTVATAVLVTVGVAVLGEGPPATQGGPYTAEQAARGEVLYKKQCVSCHGELSAFVPEMSTLLADHTFRSRWAKRSLGELFELIQLEMPQEAPGTLSRRQTADLVAYILSGNKVPAGELELGDDLEQLSQILFEP